ncbi:hypothetical protein B0H10DRAFT_2094527 [Mycena sp. CBHHK59/15]|nr:hypothetical protein B0H10DRAFT_2094527 [Mycena sp. CBHHK59/15]
MLYLKYHFLPLISIFVLRFIIARTTLSYYSFHFYLRRPHSTSSLSSLPDFLSASLFLRYVVVLPSVLSLLVLSSLRFSSYADISTPEC